VSEFAQPFREEDADPDPLRQFDSWFAQAAAAGVHLPEAAALATATPEGTPSVRMVLIKAAGADGFLFYSNYTSRKGTELSTNPRAALLFYWDPLGRQVRVEGPVQRLSAVESAAYVRTRPRASQLSALASPQSQVIASRAQLEAWVRELDVRYGNAELPLPESWGGFGLIPERLEFWQHREDRLHDRLQYTRDRDGHWLRARLAP
jgi:pyridoxamine 5'-phosphate oxidase